MADILPDDSAARKRMPITTGVIDYFPRALAAVAEISVIGNDKHNPGEPLHWAKEKSTDHADCIARHLIDRGKRGKDGSRHSAALAWRALAFLEMELEAEEFDKSVSKPRTTIQDEEISGYALCADCEHIVPDDLDRCPNCGRVLDPVDAND